MKRTRVFYSDNGTLTDLTPDVFKYEPGRAQIDQFVGAEDYIYIANVAPFNHFYLKLDEPLNHTDVVMTLQYWDGNSWANPSELMDETEHFTQNGFVTFTPSRNSTWNIDDTSGTGSSITGLTSIEIYQRYWVRLGFSNNLSANARIHYLGQRFCDDEDLYSEFPDLSRSSVLEAFQSGKGDWIEQTVRASDVIIRDLTSQTTIWSKNQILDRDEFRLACVSKTAELIFTSFGDDYEDNRILARQEYKARITNIMSALDRNGNGKLEQNEMKNYSGWLER